MGIAAVIVAGGVLLSRILGVLRDIIFAGMLGATGVTDEYVAAFTIPDFMNYLLAGGFLSITFIPIFSRYLADDDEEGGWEALTAVIRPLAVGIVLLVIVGWALAPSVIGALFPDFTPEQAAATVRLTRIVLPAQIFFVLGALFTAVQYAKGQFFIPTLAPIIYNLGIITGGILYAVFTGEADPEGFIWGAVIGAFIGNFALQWWGARRLGMHLIWRLPWRNPVILEYVKIAFPLMIGQSVVVLDETFMRMFGNMTGEGVQTQLQYARRTMLVPVGVIAQAAGVAAYPFLARQFAEGKLVQMADTVDRALPLGAGTQHRRHRPARSSLSIPTIRVLFERFEFTPADTEATASALFFYAFAIPVWGALMVITRAFYARRQMWTPVIVGTGSRAAGGAALLHLAAGVRHRGRRPRIHAGTRRLHVDAGDPVVPGARPRPPLATGARPCGAGRAAGGVRWRRRLPGRSRNPDRAADRVLLSAAGAAAGHRGVCRRGPGPRQPALAPLRPDLERVLADMSATCCAEIRQNPLPFSWGGRRPWLWTLRSARTCRRSSESGRSATAILPGSIDFLASPACLIAIQNTSWRFGNCST